MTDDRNTYGNERPRSVSSDTHSSYEEAIRRSNERLNRTQRRPRFDANAEQQATYEPTRQASSPRQSSGRPRQTIRIDDYGSASQQPAVQVQRQPVQQAPYVQPRQQRGSAYPSSPARTGAPATSTYHDQQMQARSRNSGSYQARPSGLSSRVPSLPILQNGLVVRVALCVILLIVVVFSITRIGPTAAALGDAQAAVQAQQEELDTLNKSNTDLQGQLDNMQVTLDKYNDLVAKSS